MRLHSIRLPIVALAAVGALSFADAGPTEKPAKPLVRKGKLLPKPGRLPAFTPENEAAALSFVKQHHPELADVLAALKNMRADEYQQAIRELYQVSDSLAELQGRDSRRYELMLEAWKVKSRSDLLIARMKHSRNDTLESELRSLLQRQVELQIQQHQMEKERLQARLQKIDADIERLRRDQAKVIDNRIQALNRTKPAKNTRPSPAAGTVQETGGR